jgi:NAD(P)H-dependent FMN reductase
MGWEAGKWIQRAAPDADIRIVDANKLHIVKNLSCYASGGKNCGDPKSGPYRCWAHFSSLEDPAKYGGVDQMPVIYDGLRWADTVIFTTSTRWGSHSALCQKIIERMDTLENRGAVWKEGYPLQGKRLGVIVGGLHWKTGAVAQHLLDVFRWFKFDIPTSDAALVWQFTRDVNYEQTAPLVPDVNAWMSSEQGQTALARFAHALVGDR